MAKETKDEWGKVSFYKSNFVFSLSSHTVLKFGLKQYKAVWLGLSLDDLMLFCKFTNIFDRKEDNELDPYVEVRNAILVKSNVGKRRVNSVIFSGKGVLRGRPVDVSESWESHFIPMFADKGFFVVLLDSIVYKRRLEYIERGSLRGDSYEII